jgi:hypothetical protein
LQKAHILTQKVQLNTAPSSYQRTPDIIAAQAPQMQLNELSSILTG